MIIFFNKNELDGFKEVCIEIEYCYLENYVVVDENSGENLV